MENYIEIATGILGILGVLYFMVIIGTGFLFCNESNNE